MLVSLLGGLCCAVLIQLCIACHRELSFRLLCHLSVLGVELGRGKSFDDRSSQRDVIQTTKLDCLVLVEERGGHHPSGNLGVVPAQPQQAPLEWENDFAQRTTPC